MRYVKRIWERFCYGLLEISITERSASIFLTLACLLLIGVAWRLLDFQHIVYSKNYTMASPMERTIEGLLCLGVSVWCGFTAVQFFRETRSAQIRKKQGKKARK